MPLDPFDELSLLPGAGGDEVRAQISDPALPYETPTQTTNRQVSTAQSGQRAFAASNRMKAGDFAKRQIPAYADEFGSVEPVTDSTGAAVTNYSKRHNVGYDSAGAPVQINYAESGAPALSDPFAEIPPWTDPKSGDIYKKHPALPWKYEGSDPAIKERNIEKEKDKVVAQAASTLGRKLTLDERRMHREDAEFKLRNKDFKSTFGEIDYDNPDASRKALESAFQAQYDAPENNGKDGWFSSEFSEETRAKRAAIDQQRAKALGAFDKLVTTRQTLAQRKAAVDALAQQRDALEGQRVDRAMGRLTGVIPGITPSTESAYAPSATDELESADGELAESPTGTASAPLVSPRSVSESASGAPPQPQFPLGSSQVYGHSQVDLDRSRGGGEAVGVSPSSPESSIIPGLSEAQKKSDAPKKPFFGVSDLASGVWDALSGLGTTAPAAFHGLLEGLERPDKYSPAAKEAFAKAEALQREMQAKTEARQASGESTSVGESLREAGGSLGFSGVAMGSGLLGGLAGDVVGKGLGMLAGPLGSAIIGKATKVIGQMAGAGVAAYRMAGATFLGEAFNTLEAQSMATNGRPLTEEEKAAHMEALLPIAKNTALWEAGPEAVSNAIMLGAGKALLGKAGIKTIAKKALESVGAELATETVTQVEQSGDQRKLAAYAEGRDPASESADWSPSGVVTAFKEVAPQTLALTGLMGAGAATVRGASELRNKMASKSVIPGIDDDGGTAVPPPLPTAPTGAPTAAPTAPAPVDRRAEVTQQRRDTIMQLRQARADGDTSAAKKLEAQLATINQAWKALPKEQVGSDTTTAAPAPAAAQVVAAPFDATPVLVTDPETGQQFIHTPQEGRSGSYATIEGRNPSGMSQSERLAQEVKAGRAKPYTPAAPAVPEAPVVPESPQVNRDLFAALGGIIDSSPSNTEAKEHFREALSTQEKLDRTLSFTFEGYLGKNGPGASENAKSILSTALGVSESDLVREGAGGGAVAFTNKKTGELVKVYDTGHYANQFALGTTVFDLQEKLAKVNPSLMVQAKPLPGLLGATQEKVLEGIELRYNPQDAAAVETLRKQNPVLARQLVETDIQGKGVGLQLKDGRVYAKVFDFDGLTDDGLAKYADEVRDAKMEGVPLSEFSEEAQKKLRATEAPAPKQGKFTVRDMDDAALDYHIRAAEQGRVLAPGTPVEDFEAQAAKDVLATLLPERARRAATASVIPGLEPTLAAQSEPQARAEEAAPSQPAVEVATSTPFPSASESQPVALSNEADQTRSSRTSDSEEVVPSSSDEDAAPVAAEQATAYDKASEVAGAPAPEVIPGIEQPSGRRGNRKAAKDKKGGLRASLAPVFDGPLRSAYDRLVAKDRWSTGAVSIGELAKESGVPLADLHEQLRALHKQGRVAFGVGDFSLANKVTQDGGMRAPGYDRNVLTVRPLDADVLASFTPKSPEEVFADKLREAMAKAPAEASLDMRGQSPSSITFSRPSGSGTISAQNTREAISSLAAKYGVDLQTRKYVPVVKQADGRIFEAKPLDNGEFPHGHKDAEVKAWDAGYRDKGQRGFVNDKGEFLTLMDVVREQAARRAQVRASTNAIADAVPQTKAGHSQRIAEMIGRLRDKITPKLAFKVYRNEADLSPEQLGRIKAGAIHEAVIDTAAGEIWIFTDNISSPQRAAEVFAHEAVGHYGVEQLIGTKEFQQISDLIFREAPGLSRKIARQYAKGFVDANGKDVRNLADLTPEERATVAREYVARLAEQPSINPSLWQRILAVIRKALRDLGIRREWTNAELRDLVRRAARAVESPASLTMGGIRESSLDSDPVQVGRALIDPDVPVVSSLDDIVGFPDAESAVLVDGKAVHLYDLTGETPQLMASSTATGEQAAIDALLDPAIPKVGSLDEIDAEDFPDSDKALVINPNVGRMELFGEDEEPLGTARLAPASDTSLRASIAPESTSTKNAVMEAERVQRGDPPILAAARQSHPELIAQAQREMAANPNRVQETISRVHSADIRTVSDIDEAVLLVRKAELMRDRNALMERAADPDATPEDKALARSSFKAIEEEMGEIDEATRTSGTIWGRLGALRRRLIREDFSLEAVTRRIRAQKGGPLTPEESADIKKTVDEVQKAAEALDTREKEVDDQSSREAAADFLAGIEPGPKASNAVMELAERIVRRLETSADAARKRIRGYRKQSLAGIPDPTIIYDVAVIGLAKLGRATLNFAQWSTAMREDPDLKGWVEPYLDDAWEKSKELWAEEEKKLTGSQKETVRKARVKKRDILADRAGIQDGIKAAADEGAALGDGLDKLVKQLVKNFVDAGERGLDNVTAKVKEVLEPVIPGVTDRQIQDAFSDYGKSTPITTKEADLHRADIRRQAQLTSAIKDVESGIAPKATGQQRPGPTAEQRNLTRLLNEAKRRYNIQPTDPAAALRSALDSRKTYYRNRMQDLAFEIARKERVIRDKSLSPTDAELDLLKSEYERVKADHEAVFGKREMTDEQRLEQALRAAERNEKIAAKQLEDAKKGVFPGMIGGSKPGISAAPALVAIRARADAMRAETSELKSQALGLDAAKREAALTKKIEELNGQLLAGDIAAKASGARVEPSGAAEALKSEYDAMRALVAQLRKDADPRRAPDAVEARKLEKLNREIDALDAKIAAGDLSVKARKPSSDTVAVEARKSERDAMRRLLGELRAISRRTLMTPEERALKAYKTRLAREEADLADRHAKADAGDPTAFAKRVRTPIDISKDPAAVAAKARVDKGKEELLKKELDYKLAHRSKLEVARDTALEAMSLGRAVLLSVDLGYMGLQMGTALLTHPLLVMKSLPKVMRAAWGSTGTANGWARLTGGDAALEAVNAGINLRQNAKNGLYEKMGIFIGSRNTNLTRMEESFRSRWADRVPLVAQSARAMTASLNLLRADLADVALNAYGQGTTLSPKTLKMLGNAVNIWTGRGAFGRAESVRGALNHVFLAPGWVWSRFQILYGHTMLEAAINKDPVALKLAAKHYLRWAAGMATLYGLMSFLGDEPPEADPRSSKFGMVKIGSKLYDFSAATISPLVFLSRMVTGQRLTNNGEVIQLRHQDGSTEKKKFGAKSTADLAFKFAQGKLAPVPGYLLDVSAGEDIMGRPANWATAFLNRTLPLTPRQMTQIAMEDGKTSEKTASALLQFIGINSRDEKYNAEQSMASDPVYKIVEGTRLDPRGKPSAKPNPLLPLALAKPKKKPPLIPKPAALPAFSGFGN